MSFGQGQRCAIAAVFFTVVFSVAALNAQTVTWGVGGNGGSGNWDTTTPNWFNGATNGVWPEGGNATFAGPSGGTVQIADFGVTASSLTFNTPGYSIQDGWIHGGVNGLTITTNADATIGSPMSQGLIGANLLVKDGPAALIIDDSDFLGTVQVNQGEVRLVNFSDFYFSNVNMADVTGTTITLAQYFITTEIGSLSGGGAAGGIVQPDNQGRTVTLTLRDGSTFDGRLQDNGAGKLALNLWQTVHPQILTNTNTYSGATSVYDSTLSLAGNGSARNSAFSVGGSGSLILDNTTTAVADRLSATKTISLNTSSMQLIGNSTASVNETTGPLSIAGSCSVNVTQTGSAAAQLTFGSLQRTGHATLDVGTPGVAITAIANGSTGIVAPYVTVGNEWATVGANGQIVPWNSYATDINAASTTDHVKLADVGTTSLDASATRASLNMQTSSAIGSQILDLSGNNLILSTGGLLESGNASSTIQNGTLSTPSGELIVAANNTLTIDASIVNSGAVTSFSKAGPGTVRLTGTNTYSGTTAIVQGTLVVSSDSNLGTGPTIELGGGTLQAAGDFSSNKGLVFGAATGTIDTAGHNVSFAGPNSSSLIKSGAGNLVLTNGATGPTTVAAGTLVLAHATSGDSVIYGGTLVAAGTLTTLTSSSANSPSILDIGGTSRATLNVGSLSAQSGMTADFGIGAAVHDMLTVTGYSSFPMTAGAFEFEFQNLGGVTTGVNYLLISLSGEASAPAANIFSFASDMAAAGWAGTFQSSLFGVSVRFTAVPGLPGDLNGDNIVNSQDLALVSSNWLNSGAGDANGDGIVNSQDIALISSNWLHTRSSGGMAAGQAAAVPEPSTFVLATMAILGLFAMRRRSP